MLNRIIFWSIQNKLIVAVLTFILAVVGVYSLKQLPIDAVPDITNNQVQIITSSPSSGAEDIERFVTFPVEQTMTTIPGIEEMRSFSRFGLSVVTVVFKEDIDPYWARQQVSERLSEAKNQIPPGFGEPTMAPLSTGLGEIFQYTIRAKKGFESQYDATELRTIQDWTIRRQLLGVPGVADVSGFGGKLKNYEIAIDPIKLKSHDLTIADVFQAIEKNNGNTGGAYIERHSMTTYIRTNGLIQSLTDIENIPLSETENGMPVLVKNVAVVNLGSAVRYGALTWNNKGEAVGGIVLMLKGANSSEVIESVKERIEQIKKSLPVGVELDVYLDRTNLVNRAISTVTTNLIEGALIVIFVLVLLLGNLRAGLIVASVIPLAMLFAITLMHIFGVSGNLMSLGALDFGLIVDGAVIIVESTLHILHNKGSKRLTQQEMNEEVYSSASKFSKSAVFGQIIILVVYLPILALVGIEGKMFRPMAQTVMFAILGALILSLTYVPMISSLVLSKKVKHSKTISDRIVDFFKAIYKPALRRIIRLNKISLGLILGLLVLSISLFGSLGAEFIPSLDEGDFAVETRLITGSGLSKTIEATTIASDLLIKEFSEVKEVVGKIGTAEIPTDPMPIEACDLMIILKDKNEWVSAENKEELADKMQKKLEQKLPGVSFGFQQPIQMRFNELMTGAKQDVVVKIYGENFEDLQNYAEKVGSLSRGIEGVQDVYVEEMSGLPQMIIKYNREAISKYQVSIDEINSAINIGFAGQPAGLVFEGEKRFDLVVKLDSNARQTPDDLKQLTVTSENGKQIPLNELAQVSLENGPNQIQRDDAKRRIFVGFNVRGRDVESIVNELKTKMDNNLKLKPGYYATFGGTFKNLENARDRLLIAVPAALLLIFFLLYLTFSSLLQATLIFSAIPLAAIGGVIALWLRDMPFSISAGVGFIALFGVAVLNGIVLISEFNSLAKHGHTNVIRLILIGTENRIRPVLLTAFVASLGFLPMALSHGSGAEVQKPLATVVIGGLVTATVLTLFILPILYFLATKMKKKKIKLNAVVILFSFISFQFFAQTDMNLQSCLDSAKANNKYLKSLTKKVETEQLRGNAILFPKTGASFMLGQYNSYYAWDNNLTISQSIPYPTIFKEEKELGNRKSNSIQLDYSIAWLDIKRKIESAYDTYQYLWSKRKILEKQDSILNIMQTKMQVQKELQEITKFEFSVVQTRRKSIQYQMDMLLREADNQRLVLESLIQNGNLNIKIKPEPYYVKQILLIPNDTSWLNHPILDKYSTEMDVLEQQKQVQKARNLPEFSLAYFNQTLVGYQNVNGTDKPFNQMNRFQGVQLGVDFPLLNKGYKNLQKVTDMEKNQVLLESENVSMELKNQLKQLQNQYQQLLTGMELYENQLIPESRLMENEAKISWQSGSISLLEFFQIKEMTLKTEFEYLEIKHNLNQSVTLYNWYAQK
jgi:cobalt-zinc-cadmium resistance protein CzcA